MAQGSDFGESPAPMKSGTIATFFQGILGPVGAVVRKQRDRLTLAWMGSLTSLCPTCPDALVDSRAEDHS